ncbi:uncharacterized protein N7482_001404 [Penicillium canariense]|uniref:Uncharacterized protein n=1 Tax=Penicillium canariense TaxID=189055 RepID=A0A9W9IFN9_9EURO|nr:uncharacterized protein N7482_001404 [Penicillium canariense]KAJ5175527.1 hypothetical protein N7482_001404 [Penicillium canariense]
MRSLRTIALCRGNPITEAKILHGGKDPARRQRWLRAACSSAATPQAHCRSPSKCQEDENPTQRVQMRAHPHLLPHGTLVSRRRRRAQPSEPSSTAQDMSSVVPSERKRVSDGVGVREDFAPAYTTGSQVLEAGPFGFPPKKAGG